MKTTNQHTSETSEGKQANTDTIVKTAIDTSVREISPSSIAVCSHKETLSYKCQDQPNDQAEGTASRQKSMNNTPKDSTGGCCPPPRPDSAVVIPVEHAVVKLKCEYAGVPAGSEGTVVQVYSPTEEEVGVEFAGGNVVSVMSRWLEIVWSPNDQAEAQPRVEA